MARMILAPCKTAILDAIYDNPSSDEPCSCSKCTAHRSVNPTADYPCCCSGCMPEESRTTVIASEAELSNTTAARRDRISPQMRAVGLVHFLQLREALYAKAGNENFVLPSFIYFPDTVMKYLLDHFNSIKAADDLDPILEGRRYLKPHKDELWAVIEELQVEFATIKEAARLARNECARQRRAEKKAQAAADRTSKQAEAESESSDGEVDLSSEDSDGEPEDLSPSRTPTRQAVVEGSVATIDLESKELGSATCSTQGPMSPSKYSNRSKRVREIGELPVRTFLI